MKTQFYLFSERGITDRFFCGNIYERQPNDEIKYHGQPMTFNECLQEGLCEVYASHKEALTRCRAEEQALEDSNNYANRAMDIENVYGCEGVDDMRFENSLN